MRLEQCSSGMEESKGKLRSDSKSDYKINYTTMKNKIPEAKNYSNMLFLQIPIFLDGSQ